MDASHFFLWSPLLQRNSDLLAAEGRTAAAVTSCSRLRTTSAQHNDLFMHLWEGLLFWEASTRHLGSATTV
jgi:hypothetical protein